MRGVFVLVLSAALLCSPAKADLLSQDFVEALPEEIAEIYAQEGGTDVGAFLGELLESAREIILQAVEESLRGAICLALIALLCGMVQGMSSAAMGEQGNRLVGAVGALAITAVASGDIHTLLGRGIAAIEELGTFSQVLLPTMAAALAGGGFTVTASVWQVATLFASDLLLRFVRELLLPLLYGFAALAAVGAILPHSRLDLLAAGIKKLCTWSLCAIMSFFTLFLSLSNVLCGSADKTAVKLTKSALSGAIPVVGGILSETAEALLAAAASLRGVIGVLGIVSLLAICLLPLLELGIQFLFYRAAAFVASMGGVKSIDRLIGQLGDVFALLFAMTAGCALLLTVALLVSITMVVM